MPVYARTAAREEAGLDEGGEGVLTSTGRSSSPVMSVVCESKAPRTANLAPSCR